MTIAVDNPPVANAQSVTLNQDSTSTVTLTGSDADNDPLRFKITSLPASGKLYDGSGTGGHLIGAGELPYTLTGAGNTATYQPNTAYSGPDAFQFRANDGRLDSSAAATVSITVNHVNRAPVANDDSASTPPLTPVTVNVLANDSDPDNDTLTVTSVSLPAHGVATVNLDNTVTYVPVAGYAGPDSFTYSVSDGNGGTASATVSIGVGNPPVANGQSVTLNQDSTTTVTLTGSDPDNDPLRFKITSLPASGKLYDGTGTGGHLIGAGELPYALGGAGDTTTYQPNTGPVLRAPFSVLLAARAAVPAATVDLPTPPLPVKRRIRTSRLASARQARDSTRFFSPFSAASMRIFSPLRLSIPISGIETSRARR